MKRLVQAALTEFEGIQVLSLDRTISFESGESTENVEAGHTKARSLLDQIGARSLQLPSPFCLVDCPTRAQCYAGP